jgi:cobalt-zinc-cadmium efflux system outer membrane protein
MVALTAACLPAQQPAPMLGLDDALRLAERQNLDLAAARRRRAEALAGVQIARQRPNPSVSFETARDAPHQSLLAGQPFELGGKRANRIQVAQQEARLTDAEIEVLARQVRRSVREAFYTLAGTRAETALLGRVLELAQRLQQIAEDRFNAGDVPRLEVIQAELEVARAQANRDVALQEEKVAASRLNALLNEPATREWQIRGSLEDPLPVVVLAELLDRALASNAALARLSQEQKVEQARMALLRSERVSNVEVQAGLDMNAPGDYRLGPRAGLALDLPLFTRNQGEIAQSLARQETLNAEVTAARRAVAGEVDSAFLDLNVQRTQVELHRDRLLPAARNLESLAEESYKAGRAGILVVLGAQQSVQEVERGYLESLFALQRSFAALEEAVGAPLTKP